VQIKRVHIKNFKSIVDLPLDLAPINVFIGENGSGKSNILEALAFAAAAAANKLDNEFLVSRGIRVTDPRFMRSAFAETSAGAIVVDVTDERGTCVVFELNTSGDAAYPKWQSKLKVVQPGDVLPLPSNEELAEFLSVISSTEHRSETATLEALLHRIYEAAQSPTPPVAEELKKRVSAAWMRYKAISKQNEQIPLGDFIIYSPKPARFVPSRKRARSFP